MVRARGGNRGVGSELWLHHRVTRLTAEGNRVRELVRSVAAKRAHNHKHPREHRYIGKNAPLGRLIEIKPRIGRNFSGGDLALLAPAYQHPSHDHDKADNQDRRENHES